MATNWNVRIKKCLKAPRIILSRMVMFSPINKLLADGTYLKIMYYLRTGKKLRLNNPITFNEKIQWLKLHNSSEECTRSVDKIEVREIIRKKLGDEYLIPMIGYWDSFDDIDFASLPEQFVLKCSHDSGSVLVCHNKNKLNLKSVRKKFNKALKKNYYWEGREYPYKDVKPRIIGEELMKDKDSKDLVDYKFFCFNGEPRILFYASDRFNSKDGLTKFDFYDMNLNHLPIKRKGHRNGTSAPKISNEMFSEMKRVCRILAKNYPFIRVDLYVINDKLYFGELTFHPGGGFVDYEPEEWNRTFGEWIKL